MTVHIIGDSHVSIFGGVDYMQPLWPLKVQPEDGNKRTCVPGYEHYRLGPVTAFNLYKRIPRIDSILSLVKEDDLILLSAGEIDIREHIIPKAEENCCTVEAQVQSTISYMYDVHNHIVSKGFKVGFIRPYLSRDDYKNEEKVQICDYWNDVLIFSKAQSIGLHHLILNNPDLPWHWDEHHLSQFALPHYIHQIQGLQ